MPGQSAQDRRVYVGNLPYDVKWTQLKDFMRKAGDVVFADVLTLPNGMSKGCGIVEYATREQAEHAINTLSNQPLMGRVIYVREDREASMHPVSQSMHSMYPSGGHGSGRGSFIPGGGRMAHPPSSGPMVNVAPGTQLYVGNLPYSIGWQDLKDLFRQAGSIVRADVFLGPDGRSKGSGTVVFDSRQDAQNAIARFNGYDLQGRTIEVREDRYAQGSGNPSAYSRHSTHAPSTGGHTTNSAPVQIPTSEFTDGATGGGPPSNTIHVRNLPWSTSNDDLVELFQTIGKVERAEIQYERNGRSRGSGVVQLENQDLAALAIEKFTNYSYGNRPLGLSYVRYDLSSHGQPDSVSPQMAATAQSQSLMQSNVDQQQELQEQELQEAQDYQQADMQGEDEQFQQESLESQQEQTE
ncbi:RNA-binding domain-containing protein [Dipodascopsis uninucleata]